MSRKGLVIIASVTAGIALFPAAAIAADPAHVSSIQIKGAYAYVDSSTRPHRPQNVVVVYRMAAALPRRAAGVDGSVLSSYAFGRSTAHCYTFIAGSVGRKLGPDGRRAAIGSKHTLKVATAAGDDAISDTFTVKVRSKRDAGASRKRLGC